MDPSDCLLPMWLNKDDCLLVLLSCKDDTCWATRQETSGCAGAKRTVRTKPARPDKARRAKRKDAPTSAGGGTAPRLPWFLLYCSTVRMQYSGQTDPHRVRYNNTAPHREEKHTDAMGRGHS